MSTRRLVVLVASVLFATLAISAHLAVAMPAAQDSMPLKPPGPDTGEPVIVENITVTLTTTEGLQLSAEPVAVVMTQNFEGAWPAAGWALDDLSSNDGGEFLWGKRTCHPHGGSYAGWSVGGGAQGSALNCGANYPNYAHTWAVYGPFDLRNAANASLVYYVYGRTETSSTCAFDWLFVGSSTDGTWFNGAKICGDWTTGPDGNGYTRRTLDLTNRLGQSQVWVGFQMASDHSVVFNGVTVDDVTLDVAGSITPTVTPTPRDTPTMMPTPIPTQAPSLIAVVKLPLIIRQLPPPTPTPTATPPPPHWQWQHGSHHFNGIHFINATRGWAVGDWGLIVRTNDSGVTWTVQESGTIKDMNAIQFVNVNEGWAIGDTGTILHTADGGVSWQAQSSPYAVDLEVMWFVDNQHGWIGLPDGVLKTTNGGATWTRTGSGIPARINDIQFFDANNGVAVTLSAFAGRGVVTITSDGGETWRSAACTAPWPDNCDTIWALHFPSPTFGIAVGGFVNSHQYMSTDGGATWTSRGPSFQFLESNEVYFADTSNGWAARSSTYLRTSNGGQTWSQFNGPSTYDIQLLTPNLGFVASYYNVSKTTDGGYSFSQSNKFDGVSLVDVTFANRAAGWAIGSNRIWHTVNGGQSWDLQRSDNLSLNAIDSTTPQRAWAVGSGGRIIATNNGGANWLAQTASTNYHLFDVGFVDDSYGWIVGEENSNYNPNGKVWRTTDGGAHWTQMGYFSGVNQGGHGKYGVDFVNRNVGYIVGQEVLWGSVHKTTDGGNTWSLKPLGGNLPELNAVDFINANEGWVVGDSGFIAHTNNGGNSWQIQASGVSNALTGVKFLNSHTGYAVGGYGEILQTTDGGLTWTPVVTGPSRNINGIDFVDASHGWIVGSDGTIRRYQ